MILFAILLYLFLPEVFSLSLILKIIVILLIWDIFCAVIRVKNKSFNREVNETFEIEADWNEEFPGSNTISVSSISEQGEK